MGELSKTVLRYTERELPDGSRERTTIYLEEGDRKRVHVCRETRVMQPVEFMSIDVHLE